MEFSRGLKNCFFSSEAPNGDLLLSNARIVALRGTIESYGHLFPLIQSVAGKKGDLCIFAEGLEGTVLEGLRAAVARGAFRVAVVDIRDLTETQSAELDAMAEATGSKVVGGSSGELRSLGVAAIGSSPSITIAGLSTKIQVVEPSTPPSAPPKPARAPAERQTEFHELVESVQDELARSLRGLQSQEFDVQAKIARVQRRMASLGRLAESIPGRLHAYLEDSKKGLDILADATSQPAAPDPRTVFRYSGTSKNELVDTDHLYSLFDACVDSKLTMAKSLVPPNRAAAAEQLHRTIGYIASYRASALAEAQKYKYSLAGLQAELSRLEAAQKAWRPEETLQRIEDFPATEFAHLATQGIPASPYCDPTLWQAHTVKEDLGLSQELLVGFSYLYTPWRAGHADAPEHLFMPVTVPLKDFGAWVFETGSEHSQATVSSARNIFLRLFMSLPAGALQAKFIDPQALGASVSPFAALNESDPTVLGGRAATSAEQIQLALQEIIDHIEMVIQQCLRGQFATLREFNQAAGSIEVPYKALMVFNYPTQFTPEAQFLLQRIMEHGPKCGVFPVVVHNSSIPPGPGVDPAALQGRRVSQFAPNRLYPFPGKTEVFFQHAADPIAVLGAKDGQSLVDTVLRRAG